MTQPRARHSFGPSVKLIVVCSLGIPYGLVISLLYFILTLGSFRSLTSRLPYGDMRVPGVGKYLIGTPELWLLALSELAATIIFGLFAVGCIAVITKWDFAVRLAVATPPLIMGYVIFYVCYIIVLIIRILSFIDSSRMRINYGMLGVWAICFMFALFLFLLIPILVGRWAEE